jgi:hypothetical protein
LSSVTATDVVLFAVVAARFLVPLVIPKYPLPGILASIVVDAADQSVFQALLGTDLPGYQPYDKALDVYSLSVTMLATLRNWQSRPAIAMAHFLFYFRLLGVLSFELTGWRPLLLIFPNTFEYFFVFYEIVRAWWSPVRLGTRSLVIAAGAIWIVIKVPQEYVLHVIRLDITDMIKEQILHAPVTAGWAEAAAQVLCVVASVVGVAVIGLGVRALAPPRHPRRLVADPLPRSIDEAHEWASHVAKHWRVLDRHLVEKIILVGFLTVIFAKIVPGTDVSPAQLVGGVTVLATLNSLLLLHQARKGHALAPAMLSFLFLAVTNVAFVLAVHLLLRRHHGGLSLPAAVFFLLLLSLIVTLYDRWHPVFDERFGAAGRPGTRRSPTR